MTYNLDVSTSSHFPVEIAVPAQESALISHSNEEESQTSSHYQIICKTPIATPKEQTDENGKTALFRAVEKQDFANTKKLLKQGYSPNTLAPDGTSMLAVAMRYFDAPLIGNEKINHTSKQYALIKLLLEHQANPKIGFKEKRSAFDHALMLRNSTLLQMLCPYKEPDYRFNKETISSFFFICSAKELQVTLEIYPSLIDEHYSCIHYCVEHNNIQALELFYKKHPDFFAKAMHQREVSNIDGKTPRTPLELALLSAATSQSLRTASFLAQHGGILETLGDFETCHLSQGLFEWLLADKRILHIQNCYGDTLLHLLVSEGSYSRRQHYIQQLIEAGADIRIKNSQGFSVVDIARCLDFQTALSLLRRSKYADDLPKPKWHEALLPGHIVELQELLASDEKRQVFEIKDPFGASIVQKAIEHNNLEAIRLLKTSLLNTPLAHLIDTTACLKQAARQANSATFVEFYTDFCTLKNITVSSGLWELKPILQEAISSCNQEIIDWFLQSFPTDASLWEEFSLSEVISSGSQELYRRTISSADEYEKAKAFHAALQSKQLEMALLLVDSLSPLSFFPDINKSTVYHLLIQLGSEELLKRFIAKVSINPYQIAQKNIFGQDAFDIACAQGRLDLVEILWSNAFATMKAQNDPYRMKEFIQRTFQIGSTSCIETLLADPECLQTMKTLTIRPKGYTNSCSLLAYAAQQGSVQIVRLLINHGFSIIETPEFLSGIPGDSALFFAILSNNSQLIRLIVEVYHKQRLVPHIAALFDDILLYKQEHSIDNVIITTALQTLIPFIRPHITPQQTRELTEAISRICPDNRLVIETLRYVLSSHESPAEWKITLLKLEDFFAALPKACTVYYGNLSLEQTVFWVKKQLIEHIFLGMNPALSQDPLVFSQLVRALKEVKAPEDYGYLFVAMQSASSTNMALLAFTAAKEKDALGESPSKQQLLSTEMSDEEKIKWLSYTAVYKDRNGIAACFSIIKQFQRYPTLLPLALQAIERIAIASHPRTHILLQEVVNHAAVEEHRLLALKALNATHYKIPQETLFEWLRQARKNRHHSFEIACLEMLCRDASDLQATELVRFLIDFLGEATEDVRIAIIQGLSNIPDEQGLLYALKLVNGSDWDRFAKDFGKNRHDVLGDFLTFRSRPEHLHDSRSAMVERIQNRLVELRMKDLQFKELVEKTFADFQKEPARNAALEKLHSVITDGLKAHIRYCSTPYFYPPGTDLIRGLSTRKGDAGFLESIRDLIRKGCGSASLTDNEADITGGTWKKLGHIFASHCKDLFFSEDEGCTYFSANKEGVVSDSALVIFPASVYQSEYFQGQGRIERENTFNNVLYRGVSKEQIGALYLPARFKSDILLLGGNLPLERLQTQLSSDLFRTCSIKELQEFRRHLQVKENTSAVSFHEKIRFFEEGNAKTVERQLLADGCRFADETEVIEETLKWAIGRQLIQQQYQRQLLTQDQLLQELDDAAFNKALPEFIQMLPKKWRSCINEQALAAITTRSMEPEERAITRLSALFGPQSEQVQQHHHFFGLTQH